MYPHYGEEVFKNVKEFKGKEREIKEAQEAYNQAVKRDNTLLENVSLDMQKTEDNFSKYDKIKAEGERELKSCRYYESVLYKLSSKKTKIELNLDTLKHNTEKFRHILDMMKGEFPIYKAKPLELMRC